MFIKIGLLALPVIIKLVGILLGLYFALDYMKDTAKEIWQQVKKIKSRTCHSSCKRKLIEKSAAFLGTLTEVILLGGLGDLKKVKIVVNKPKVRNLLKKYKIEFDSDLFEHEHNPELQEALKGFQDNIKQLAKKIGYDGFTAADDYKNSPVYIRYIMRRRRRKNILL